MRNFHIKIVTIAALLAFIVVILGAYTRLTAAGLGCPDWPGCYGHLFVPHSQSGISQAQQNYPAIPLEQSKAWTEMIHRYAASIVGLLILIAFTLAFYVRFFQNKQSNIILPASLCLLVVFQALLGMWTVTLKLLPIVVMGHLLGGMTIVTTLWWYRLKLSGTYAQAVTSDRKRYRPYAVVALMIVIMQITLGGWVSANYAGIACIGFPYCNGQLLPALHVKEAFHVAIGANYQGGLLSSETRVSIQMIHRIGALLTLLYLSGFSFWLFFTSRAKHLRQLAVMMMGILLTQFTLGVLNVLFFLPLFLAVAHNAVAALLLLTVATLSYSVFISDGAYNEQQPQSHVYVR